MKQLEKNYKRIVVKIGGSLLCTDNNLLNFKVFKEIASQIIQLASKGKEVIIVSSGAIALGMDILGLKERPKELKYLQAAAAVGQNELMNAYRKFFGKRNFAAQILLTWEDFSDRKRYLNAKNTLTALLVSDKNHAQRIIPVINENDTVSTDEIKFGDNDRLSALVTSMVSADILIILSDVDGLIDRDNTVIRQIEKITPQIKALACPTYKKTCVGGMVTKIEAAKISVDSGIPCVIANGRKKNIILSLLQNPLQYGTLFVPKKSLTAKKQWIAFGSKPKGKIIVDQGAEKALLNKKSLLSVGIIANTGDFQAGDIVSILNNQNYEFARGKVTISSNQLDKIKGSRYDKEIIHCDNIVIINQF